MRPIDPAPDTPALAVGLQRLPLALTAADVNVPMIADIDGFRLNAGSDDEAGRYSPRLDAPSGGAE